MLETLKKNRIAQLVVVLFFVLTGWWISLQLSGNAADNNWFGIAYGSVALTGALVGLKISKRWGGLKSYIGRAIAMFSLGLFAQEFGQIAYWFYVFVLKSEVPYPSVGDLGFFGSIPLYIYGVVLLAKASGTRVSLKSLGNKLQAFIIPLLLLVVSYRLFLRGYELDWSHPLTVFLDFGYPFGQAIYISIAILAFLFSRKLLGGLMRSKILLILFALLAQYISDFTFLYQTHNETWQANGINDYMYLVSYLIMALAIMNFGTLFNKLQSHRAEQQGEA
jgi:hypothetical protein